jgi:hypothetical protein
MAFTDLLATPKSNEGGLRRLACHAVVPTKAGVAATPYRTSCENLQVKHGKGFAVNLLKVLHELKRRFPSS